MKIFFLTLFVVFSCQQADEIVPEIIDHPKEQAEEMLIYIQERGPYFPFGQDSLRKHFEVRIPHTGCGKDKVFVSFVIDEKGRATNFEIIRGMGHPYDSLILKRIQPLPDFIPAEQRGKTVRCRMIAPVIVRL